MIAREADGTGTMAVAGPRGVMGATVRVGGLATPIRDAADIGPPAGDAAATSDGSTRAVDHTEEQGMGDDHTTDDAPGDAGPRHESDDTSASDAGLTGDEGVGTARPAIPDGDRDEDEDDDS